jgi:lipopolysaccharide biosynthesis protein
MERKARVIAFYLPQFHPIPDNDKWWGKGFTEWRTVGKAKPLFKGHYQPRVPSDLGYYDLRIPEIRDSQAAMAREAGLYGFCYWHYWFGNGKQLLERPFNEVLSSGSPDFPFCLGWANESWEAKVWNATEVKTNELLIEQQYPGVEDNKLHFNTLLSAFKDKRYITVNNSPVFLIYRPEQFGNIKSFIQQWNDLARSNGLENGFYFIAHTPAFKEFRNLIDLGFNSITVNPMSRVINNINDSKSKLSRRIEKIKRYLFKIKILTIYEYKDVLKYFVNKEEDSIENVIPTIIPNWDHSPRSGRNAWILHNSNPKYFKQNIIDALECVESKQEEAKIIFLKSWNEWGEGNYIEPDILFGHSYLDTLKNMLIDNGGK